MELFKSIVVVIPMEKFERTGEGDARVSFSHIISWNYPPAFEMNA
jgi:hypothetical protein